VVDRKSLTYVTLKKAGFEEVHGDPQEPSSTYNYGLAKYGITCVFFNGTLTTLRLSKTETTGAGIGRERDKQFYPLPLTQQQFEQIFGHPEKASDKAHL